MGPGGHLREEQQMMGRGVSASGAPDKRTNLSALTIARRMPMA